MEAVPRLPMLSCELKISPSNSDFGPALKKYIQEFYHENPEAYNKEIKELESLRQSACKVPRDFTGCRILKRYYSQLHSLQSRFPMSEDGAASVPFMWSDIYSGITFNITDIRYEQACVLYNIGALHSELGATDSRSNAEGMKVSCTHFQCAAWAFQHLRETYPQPKGSDMSHDLLTFFITLMLAQAQECILEKSMLDSRKSTITAKLAAQVVEYYKSALATLVSGSSSADAGCILDIIGSKNFKHWKKFLEFKMLYYGCLSHLYMGNQAEEQQQMGERVAWYQSAVDKHTEAVKISKTMDREDIAEALTFTLDVIGGKYNAAKKENDFVYHEKVQAAESLPEIKGASLVKGIPFSTSDPDISGPDIFVRLVPMEAHEAASVYSEEKAKLLRLVAAKIEDKDQELVTYLASLKLDANLLAPKEEKIPQELLEICAALSVRTNIVQDLTAALNALTEVYEEVNGSLKEAQDLLTHEEKGEKLHQETFEKRPTSLIVLELNKEFSKYQEAHRRASESNSTLQKAMSMHVVNLELLSGPLDELQKALPSINLMDTPNDESAGRELQQLMEKVEEMRRQRTMLESQLRDAIQNDDITKQLVMRDKKYSMQKLFEDELKKHDTLVGYLDQNLNAQDNILRALTKTVARYADTRKAIAEATERRELKVATLLNSYAAYEDLIAKAQKGLEFYRKLQTNVSKLLARVRSVTSVLGEERQQIIEAHARKKGVKLAVADGPKLKDYLPYMTPGMKGLPEIPSVPSSTSLSHSTEGPKLKDYWCYNPQGSSKIPPRPSSPTSTVPGWKSAEFPSTMDVSAPSSNAIVAMGVRPAPVGSEQTGLPTNCSSNLRTRDVKSVVAPEQQWNFSQRQPQHPSYPSYPNSSIPGPSYAQPPSVAIPQHSTLVSPYGSYNPAHSYGTSFVPSATPEGVGSASIYSAHRTSYSQIPTSLTSVSSPVTPAAAFTKNNNDQGSYYQNNSDYRQYTFSQQPGDWATSSVYTYKNNSIVSSSQGQVSLQPGNQRVAPQWADPSRLPVTSEPVAFKQWTGSERYSSVSQSVPQPTNQILPHHVGYPQGYVPESHPAFVSTATSQWPNQYQVVPSSGNNAAWSGQNVPTQATPQHWTGHQSQQWSGNEQTPNSAQSWFGQTQPASGSSSQLVGQKQVGEAAAWTGEQWNNQVPQAPTVTPGMGPLQPGVQTNMQWTNQMQPATQWTNQGQTITSSSQCASSNNQQLMQPTPGINQSWTGSSSSAVDPRTSLKQWPGPDTNLSSLQSIATNVVDCPIPAITPEVIPNGVPLKPIQANETSRPNSASSSPSRTIPNSMTENRDLLAKIPNGTPDLPVLQPVVVSMSEMNLQKEEKEPKDPLSDSATLQRFVADVEKFEKFVEGLTRKTLNGPTPLDQKWKEVIDAQERETRKLSISVARCYPLKNRFPDIMPYDNNRVAINLVKNDYINASFVKDIMPKCPNFIVTQAPLSSTLVDFWVMVWEQQVEIIVCLLSTPELKGLVYWPQERGQQMTHGPVTLSIQSTRCKQFFTEYMINITHNETRMSRVAVHLQFLGWGTSTVPTSPSQLLQFVQEFHSYHRQQRNLQKPVIVHCSGGVGRSGVFCLLSTAVKEMGRGNSPPELCHIASRMSQQRKFLLQEKEQLKFSYDAALYYAQDILMKRGILTNKTSTFAPSGGSHTRHPSEDFILGGSLKLDPVKTEDVPKMTEDNAAAPNNEEDTKTTALAVEQIPCNLKPEDNEELLANDSSKETEESSNVLPAGEIHCDHTSTPSITSLLDPATFTMDPVASPSKRRITRDSFSNPPGLIQSGNDPLSLLDPMWSLKKNKE